MPARLLLLALLLSASSAYADHAGLGCTATAALPDGGSAELPCDRPAPAGCPKDAEGAELQVGPRRVWVGVQHDVDAGMERIAVALPSADGGTRCLRIDSGVAPDDEFAPDLRVENDSQLPMELRVSLFARSGCLSEIGGMVVACPLLSPGCFEAEPYRFETDSRCDDDDAQPAPSPSAAQLRKERQAAAALARGKAALAKGNLALAEPALVAAAKVLGEGELALAQLRARQGRDADAERLWLTVIATSPGQGDALLGLADLYWTAGHRDEARGLYVRFLHASRGARGVDPAALARARDRSGSPKPDGGR